MADPHGAVTEDIGMDYAEHERTYKLFIGLVKWVSIMVVLLLVLMAYFLL